MTKLRFHSFWEPWLHSAIKLILKNLINLMDQVLIPWVKKIVYNKFKNLNR